MALILPRGARAGRGARVAGRGPRGARGAGRGARPPPYAPIVTRENKLGRETRPKGISEPVSELTTNRLSVYLRCLNTLDAASVRTISSQGLAEQFHLNAAQIRK